MLCNEGDAPRIVETFCCFCCGLLLLLVLLLLLLLLSLCVSVCDTYALLGMQVHASDERSVTAQC